MKKKHSIPPVIIFLTSLTIFIVGYSMLAPILYPIDLSAVNLSNRLLKPSIFNLTDSGHIFGTDVLGRDIGVRLLYATRTSVLISLTGLFFSSVIGTGLGIVSGLYGGVLDDIIVFLINVRHSIPAIIIGIVVVTIFGSSETMLIVLITSIFWTGFARQVRAQILAIKSETFIECSYAIGASKLRVLFEHILVNIASPLIVVATLNLSGIILFENTMSFLGIGIQPPATSLGVMVSTGRDQLLVNWWLAIIPCIVIVIIVTTMSLLGDWLRDKLDPSVGKR